MARQKILEKAKNTILKNIVHTCFGDLVTAGGHQFRTLWVRDFCYSVPGLLAMGCDELVERQIRLIAKNIRNGLVPRGLDEINPKVRVLRHTVLRFLPSLSDESKYSRPPKPEYLGEHGTPAFDSGLLLLRAAADFALLTGKALPLSPTEIQNLLSYYEAHWREELLWQPAFSDWQDSVRREGHILLTQLLYLDAVEKLKKLGFKNLHEKAEPLQKQILKKFYRSDIGLFSENPDHNQFSLDSHTFLLTKSLLLPELEKKLLYANLKQSPLWKSDPIPGRPIYPNHPMGSVSWTTKLIGLTHYHDECLWGWLIAEAVKTARQMGDLPEAERISCAFAKLTSEQDFLGEIYAVSGEEIRPWKNFWYQSECPFTWTAAKWLEALSDQGC